MHAAECTKNIELTGQRLHFCDSSQTDTTTFSYEKDVVHISVVHRFSLKCINIDDRGCSTRYQIATEFRVVSIDSVARRLTTHVTYTGFKCSKRIRNVRIEKKRNRLNKKALGESFES